jgi:hypothetical protein
MNKVNALSPTLKNVLNLVFQYYIVFWIFQSIRSYNQVQGGTSPSGKAWEKVFEVCMSTVALAPMLAILFIGTRLRASSLQPGAAPPSYAQQAMFICSTAVFTLTLASGGISFVNEYMLPMFSIHNPFKAENDAMMGKEPGDDTEDEDFFGKDSAALDATRLTNAYALQQTPNLDPKKMTIGDVPPHTPRADAPPHHHAVHQARTSL